MNRLRKTVYDTGEKANEMPPINPNNASNKMYKNISILK